MAEKPSRRCFLKKSVRGRVDFYPPVEYYDTVIVSLYLLSQKVSTGYYMVRHIIPRFSISVSKN